MDALDALMTRRSIRTYDTKPVPKDLVQKLLSAAMNAPSAGNQQPWQFVVIDDRETLEELSRIHPHGKMLAHAPLAVAVCADTAHEKHKGYWVQDCSAATQNLLLAAHACGLGAVWLGVYPREERMKGIAEFIKMPGYIVPLSLISIGWPAEKVAAASRYAQTRVHWNFW
jgi:nitroreductase